MNTLIIFILLIIVIFVLWFFKRTRKQKISAIIGLCGAGKTQLFSSLCHNSNLLTVTSIKENSGILSINDTKNLTVVDIPGNDRIREPMIEKFKGEIGFIVFLIDSSTIQQNIKDVAQFLYKLLCDKSLQDSRTSVLIACNKQDIATAKASTLIKSSLEREIEVLRATSTKQLKSVGPGEIRKRAKLIGSLTEDFKFEQSDYNKIDFVECIAEDGKDITGVLNWLKLKA